MDFIECNCIGLLSVTLLNFELALPIIGEERPIDMSNLECALLQRDRAKQVRKALSSTYHRPPVQPLIPRSNLQLSKEAIMCAQRSLVRSPVTGLAVSSRTRQLSFSPQPQAGFCIGFVSEGDLKPS